MRAAALLATALSAIAAAAGAQPSVEPRRFALGVELSAAVGPEDRGFFNYTSYEDSAQRLARLSLTAEWHVAESVALLGEVRDENLRRPRVYALYARVRPWRDHAFVRVPDIDMDVCLLSLAWTAGQSPRLDKRMSSGGRRSFER